MTRRELLRNAAMAAAGATLYACTGGGAKVPPSPVDATVLRQTRWPVKRVIYLMLENRSFDNILGRFPGLGKWGTTTGTRWRWPEGPAEEVDLIRCPDWLPGDLPHDRAAHLNSMRGGNWDGFALGTWGPTFAYSQLWEPDVPNYWHWAREYALSVNFFASAGGPSYPNHFFYIAGQSGGVIDNPENIETEVVPGMPYRFKSWGCDAVGDDIFVFVKDDRGNLTKHDPCFDMRTMGEELSAAGVDWTYYSARPGQIGYFWNAYNAIEQVFHDTRYFDAHTRPIDDLVRDIERNRLPAVTWATPLFQLSDHPPASSAAAHNWVTDIVNALMRSDMWEHTVLFITWDEWGGFFDHVPPQAVDEVGLGVRVPLLTISPFIAQRGIIDDLQGEFSTPLRFIADNWDLPYLTDRIADTHNFEHVFDFSGKPRPPVIATKKVDTYVDDPLRYPFGPGDHFKEWPKGLAIPEGEGEWSPPW